MDWIYLTFHEPVGVFGKVKLMVGPLRDTHQLCTSQTLAHWVTEMSFGLDTFSQQFHSYLPI